MKIKLIKICKKRVNSKLDDEEEVEGYIINKTNQSLKTRQK